VLLDKRADRTVLRSLLSILMKTIVKEKSLICSCL